MRYLTYSNIPYEHQISSTPPTKQLDGKPLIVGDRWQDINNDYAWFRWNGANWESEETLSVSIRFAASENASVVYNVLPVDPTRGTILVVKTHISGACSSSSNNNNNWKFQLAYKAGSSIVPIGSQLSTAQIGTDEFYFSELLNQRLDVVALAIKSLKISLSKNSLATGNLLSGGFKLDYRRIR